MKVNVKMSDELNDDDNKLFLKEKDCAIVISEEGDMNVILPKLGDGEVPDENISESIFLISFLSHAITRQDWIEEYVNRFENNFEAIAAQFVSQFGTDHEVEGDDESDEGDSVDESDEKEINFTSEMSKLHKNKPKIIT